MLKHADQEAGDDVDGHDQNGGQGIALTEARRAIHRAAEFRLARHPLPACFGLCLIDDAGVQIGIDRHLLAWHGIESKAGRDLRRTHGAMGNDQELNGDQGQEEDEANDVIAANHELTKGFDHLARSRGALIAMQQNAPRAGQVERQAKQGE